MSANTVRFQDWEAERMQDPDFRAVAEEQEPAYQIARLRILRGMTQKELADRVGTRQPNISTQPRRLPPTHITSKRWRTPPHRNKN